MTDKAVNDLNLQHEHEIWMKFYCTFNDDNPRHAINSFYNCIAAGLFEETAESLHDENVKWYREIKEHGCTDEEILREMPEAAEYMGKQTDNLLAKGERPSVLARLNEPLPRAAVPDKKHHAKEEHEHGR